MLKFKRCVRVNQAQMLKLKTPEVVVFEFQIVSEDLVKM